MMLKQLAVVGSPLMEKVRCSSGNVGSVSVCSAKVEYPSLTYYLKLAAQKKTNSYEAPSKQIIIV